MSSFALDREQTYSNRSIKCDSGPPGPRGITGATGATGPPGFPGSFGGIGPAGSTGATGPPGGVGPRGLRGSTDSTGLHCQRTSIYANDFEYTGWAKKPGLFLKVCKSRIRGIE